MRMKHHPDLPLVLQTAKHCHDILAMAELRHVIIGGLAVYLHGDRDRQPRDVDLLILQRWVGITSLQLATIDSHLYDSVFAFTGSTCNLWKNLMTT